MTRAAKRDISEHDLQKTVCQYLDAVLPSSVRYFAVPNGGHRNKATAGRLKAEGVKAGIPDLVFLRGGSAAFVEMKTGTGRLSVAQAEFLEWAVANGFEAAVCRSVDDVRGLLKAWGVEIREVGR